MMCTDLSRAETQFGHLTRPTPAHPEEKVEPTRAISAETVARKVGLPAEQVFKTLVTRVDGVLTVAVVPVAGTLDLKALAADHGFSLPTFWVGLMLIMVFAVMLGWLPSTGRGDFGTWTAVSRPPFFTALALWPKGD